MNDTEVLARLLAAHRLIAEVEAVTGLRASISNEIIIRGELSVQFARRQARCQKTGTGARRGATTLQSSTTCEPAPSRPVTARFPTTLPAARPPPGRPPV